ncbi:MAG: SpoIIE family protein phosphatase [Ignavibacteriales bacterium]|nr:SpoIIE family protein phosphatase [Ignavibacteriales bacterium]
METIIQLLKENIRQRKQNITEFLRNAGTQTVSMRVGPSGEKAAEKQLQQLDSFLKKADDQTLGLCEVCHDLVNENRLEMDYSSCVCLEHLSGEERTRLENDLELSQKVQQALLPHTVPDIRGLDVAAFSQPARIVGGDYFDFLRFKDGSHAFAIADVMGKGMPASMLMANLQASLRILTPESECPEQVISRLNELFGRNIRLTKFVTFFLAQFDETTRTLTYCNAGHNPPLLHRRNGNIERLLPTGAAIGLIEQSTFSQNSLVLLPGDRLMLYTDGVVESFNDKQEMYGEETLEQFLKKTSHISGSQVIASLREALHTFTKTNAPADDTTIIVITAL